MGINVTVNPLNSVSVKVNPQQDYTVKNIKYGINTLKEAQDLDTVGGETGDIIVYNAATKQFDVAPASSAIPSLDAGLF